MTHESRLAVARVIQRHEPLHADVLSCRYEVLWADGSRVYLHPVRQNDADAHKLRALFHQGRWILFDLAKVIPKTAAELLDGNLRDHPGIVMYGLRAAFHNAADLLAALQAQNKAAWDGEDREPGQRPTGTGRAPMSARHQPSPSPALSLHVAGA